MTILEQVPTVGAPTAHEPAAMWWVQVAQTLDLLKENLDMEVFEDTRPAGNLEQATVRQPALEAKARQVALDGHAALDRIVKLRKQVAKFAGEPSAVPLIAGELKLTTSVVESYRRRSRSVRSRGQFLPGPRCHIDVVPACSLA